MKDLVITLFLIIGLGFASCTPVYYKPDTHNVPLISQKGETNLTFSGNPEQLGFEGAFGAAENFAIKANGSLFIPSYDEDFDGGSGRLIEFGAGYFLPIKNGFVFEAYGIFGFGSMENHFPSTIINQEPPRKGEISANFSRVGVQPNFGYKSKYFSAAVSSRIVGLSYKKIEGDLLKDEIYEVVYLEDNSSHFLIEPALTLRAGIDKFKFQVQLGYSANLTNPNFKQENSFLTIGLNFNFL